MERIDDKGIICLKLEWGFINILKWLCKTGNNNNQAVNTCMPFCILQISLNVFIISTAQKYLQSGKNRLNNANHRLNNGLMLKINKKFLQFYSKHTHKHTTWFKNVQRNWVDVSPKKI